MSEPFPEPEVFSSGYLVFRHRAQLEFLLMKHTNRWDLPKGHLDEGENSAQAALRELAEETGFSDDAIWTDPEFRYVDTYRVLSRGDANRDNSKRPGTAGQRLKELTIYLGYLLNDMEVVPTEHLSFAWFAWQPPHRIQAETIDPLLARVAVHLASKATWPPKSLSIDGPSVRR